MPINFKEFLVYPGFAESQNSHNVLPAATRDANTWLKANPSRVLNVEPITSIDGGGVMGVTTRYLGVRVWYEEHGDTPR